VTFPEATTFVVWKALEANALPVIPMTAPPVTGVNPPAPKRLVDAAVVKKALGVVMAFEAKMFPVTPIVGPPVTGANPPAPKRLVDVAVVKKALGVVKAFEAKMFPETVRFAPAVDVPIPTGFM
jgi:hypothetical protein